MLITQSNEQQYKYEYASNKNRTKHKENTRGLLQKLSATNLTSLLEKPSATFLSVLFVLLSFGSAFSEPTEILKHTRNGRDRCFGR
jgi:hypothetical protein